MNIISKEEAKLLGLTRFFTGNACKHGHIDERLTSDNRCISCKRITEKKKRDKNPLAYKERSRNSHAKHRAERLKQQKIYSQNRMLENPELVRSMARARMSKWMSVPENRLRVQESQRRRYRENPSKYINKTKEYYKKNPDYVFARKTIERISGRSSLGAFSSKLTAENCESILGYSRADFLEHIESLWLEGMSWLNRSEWHIDHIRPISSFIRDGITDVATINALSNLRPLWAKDNLSKGSKY